MVVRICRGFRGNNYMFFLSVILVCVAGHATLDNEQNADLVAFFEKTAQLNSLDKFILASDSQDDGNDEDESIQKLKTLEANIKSSIADAKTTDVEQKNSSKKHEHDIVNFMRPSHETTSLQKNRTAKVQNHTSLTSFFEKEKHKINDGDGEITEDDEDHEYISDVEEEQGISPLHDLPIFDNLISGKEFEFKDDSVTPSSRSLSGSSNKHGGDDGFEIKVRNGTNGNILALPENARMDLEDPLANGDLTSDKNEANIIQKSKETTVYKDPIATLNHAYEHLAKINDILDEQMVANRRSKSKNESIVTAQTEKKVEKQTKKVQSDKTKIKANPNMPVKPQHFTDNIAHTVSKPLTNKNINNKLTNEGLKYSHSVNPANKAINNAPKLPSQQPKIVNKMMNTNAQNPYLVKYKNTYSPYSVSDPYPYSTQNVYGKKAQPVESNPLNQYVNTLPPTPNLNLGDNLQTPLQSQQIAKIHEYNERILNSINNQPIIPQAYEQLKGFTPSYINNKITFVQVPPTKDTHCMDGSPPAYYKRQGYGEGKDKWIIHLHGGAWCYDLRSCSKRRNSILGSTKRSLDEDIEGFFHGILSNDPYVNPHFYNWNTVVLTYCDGGLFSGNREKPLLGKGKKYYFQGRRVLKSQLQNIQSTTNLNDAKKVVLSGTSAGGLSLLLQANFIRRFLPDDAKVRGLVDAGFFLDQDSIWNTSISSIQFKALYSLHRPTLSRACVEKQSVGKKFKCLFPHETIQSVRIPLFLVNSLYDHWQLSYLEGISCVYDDNKCDQLQHDRVLGFRNKMYTALNDVAKHSNTTGVFANSCFGHGQVILDYTWSKAKINRKTISDAFYEWFNDDEMKSQKRHFHADCKLPCNGSCNRLLAKRCVLNFKNASPQRQRRDAELC